MNPELQTLVDRIELLERQSRGWKSTALLALALAATSLIVASLPVLKPRPSIPGTPAASADRARYSVVEANRFLLRSPGGDVSGGLEVDGRGNIRLVLGAPRTAAAFLEIEHGGAPRLTLRGEDGANRVALTGGDRPALALSAPNAPPTAVVSTASDGTGMVQLTTVSGRTRFRAP
jgi:hypothetical protein